MTTPPHRKSSAQCPNCDKYFDEFGPKGGVCYGCGGHWTREELQHPGAATGEAGIQQTALRWRTAAEIASLEGEHPDWVVRHCVARRTITELEGKIKVGKTTFVASLTAGVLSGARFLNQPTSRGPVIWLTEERAPTFRSALARVGLLDRDDLHILSFGEARGLEWRGIIDVVLAKATAVDAALVIIDTMPTWAGIPGDGENASGEALAAMRDVARLAEAGLAVIVVRHGRKSGGEIGDSGRGSSAWGGAADVLLSLRRVEGQGHESRRRLEAVGRFDGIPPSTTIEFRDGEYVALGDSQVIEAHDLRVALLDILPQDEEHAMINDQILERLGGRGSRTTFQRVRDALLAEGEIARVEGLGKTGRAHGYYRREYPPNDVPNLEKRVGQLICDPHPSAHGNDVPNAPSLDGQSISPVADREVVEL